MQIPLCERNKSTKRTLENLEADRTRFEKESGDIKHVKEFNNVLYKPLFNIPIDQVTIQTYVLRINENNVSQSSSASVKYTVKPQTYLFQVALPALHISLGSYLKFFNMLEDECHILGCQLTCHNSKGNNNEEFKKYIEVRKTVTDLEKDVADIQNTIALINNAISVAIMESADNDKNIKEIYEPRLNHYVKKRNEKVWFVLHL